MAEEHRAKPAQIALAWILHKPYITCPVLGSTRLSHLEDGVAALQIELTEEQVARLEAHYRPHPVAGPM